MSRDQLALFLNLGIFRTGECSNIEGFLLPGAGALNLKCHNMQMMPLISLRTKDPFFASSLVVSKYEKGSAAKLNAA